MRKRLFRSLLLFAILLPVWSGDLAAQSATTDTLTSKVSTDIPIALGHGTFGLWSGGVLLAVQDRFSSGPIVRVIDREGRQTERFSIAIPGASGVNLYENSIARGPDGSLAVVGSASVSDPTCGTFLAWISPDRSEQTIVCLSPFFPHGVTLASDGTIWVAGHDTTIIGGQRDYSQHLIRHYDKSGKMLGSFIPWSSLGTAPGTLSPDSESILVSIADRIGWYSPSIQTYFEFSLDGAVINSIQTPEHARGEMLSVALCDDGRLFVGASILGNGTNRAPSWGIHVLDRQRGGWNFIPRGEKWGMLYGCDGTRLASTTDSRTIAWLERAGK